MSLFILDTDMLSLLREQHPTASACWASRPSHDRVATTVISVEEQLVGWLALLRRRQPRDRLAWIYQQMAEASSFLSHFPILAFPEAAILRYEQLVALRLNIGRMDLRIAAIALEVSAVVVTRNRRDFGRVPGLVLEDWSV